MRIILSYVPIIEAESKIRKDKEGKFKGGLGADTSYKDR